MKKIEVVAAVICRDGKIFATQRGYGDQKDGWEFPGGKVECGETQQAALIREIREELDAEIRVDRFLQTIEADYPKFHLVMHCYLCSLISDELTLKEHENAGWIGESTLETPDWLPADRELLPAIRSAMHWKE